MLQFGSGNSTLWLAERNQHVVSIGETLSGIGSSPSLVGRPRQREPLAATSAVRSAVPTIPADSAFCPVDGLARDHAMERAVSKVVPGGFIYLDNSDVQDAEHQRARQLLLQAYEPSSIETFVGFSPVHVTVGQGILGRLQSFRVLTW